MSVSEKQTIRQLLNRNDEFKNELVKLKLENMNLSDMVLRNAESTIKATKLLALAEDRFRAGEELAKYLDGPTDPDILQLLADKLQAAIAAYEAAVKGEGE